MRGHREKLSGNETEAFSICHHHDRRWRAGARKRVKRAFAKRLRLKARIRLAGGIGSGRTRTGKKS